MDSRSAEEEAVSGLGFVLAKKSFAPQIDLDIPVISGLFEELDEPTILFLGQDKQRITTGPPLGKHLKEPPSGHPDTDQEISNFRELFKILLIDAGDDIVDDGVIIGDVCNMTGYPIERIVVSQPIMGVGEAVETDGDGLQPGLKKSLIAIIAQQEAIGYGSPGKTSLRKLVATRFEIFSQQGFTTSDGNGRLLGNDDLFLD